jgi:CO/xanthine dehydrogenase FAD-binding subunit
MRIGRTPADIALLNAAAFVQVTDGIYSRVCLALGGVNMEPVRLQAVERELEGQAVPNAAAWTQFIAPILQACMADFRPPSDFRASSGYRRTSGISLAYSVLEEATSLSCW